MKFTLTCLFLLSLSISSSHSSTNKVNNISKPPSNLSQYVKWRSLTGKWLGVNESPDGVKSKWLIHRKKDGTYTITFRTYDLNGKVTESKEAGHWRVSGPVYMSMFRAHIENDKFYPVDPSDPHNYDAYEIVKLTHKEFTYRHYEDNILFSVKKMKHNYVLPK